MIILHWFQLYRGETSVHCCQCVPVCSPTRQFCKYPICAYNKRSSNTLSSVSERVCEIVSYLPRASRSASCSLSFSSVSALREWSSCLTVCSSDSAFGLRTHTYLLSYQIEDLLCFYNYYGLTVAHILTLTHKENFACFRNYFNTFSNLRHSHKEFLSDLVPFLSHKLLLHTANEKNKQARGQRLKFTESEAFHWKSAELNA